MEIKTKQQALQKYSDEVMMHKEKFEKELGDQGDKIERAQRSF